MSLLQSCKEKEAGTFAYYDGPWSLQRLLSVIVVSEIESALWRKVPVKGQRTAKGLMRKARGTSEGWLIAWKQKVDA